ncbi:DNA cytosine methyltransferase [Rhizobium sp. Rhizsp42]|uniref:DNA cytosine methyltransferase n=1 Tax=Rhizobium sp. Rhizsp42 TaxID=3243034 RepID=UPI0039B0E404
MPKSTPNKNTSETTKGKQLSKSEQRLVRARAHLARIRSDIKVQIPKLVSDVDVLTKGGRANVEVVMRDLGYTDAEYQTFANLTARLANVETEIAGEDVHFEQYRALVKIDDDSRALAARAIKRDSAVTHDEILGISERIARKKTSQGHRAFESSRAAFENAFAEENRIVEKNFRGIATKLFGMMEKHSRRSSYVNRTPKRSWRVSSSPRYSFFRESQNTLLADIIATSAELLNLMRAIFPGSAAPMREWAYIANHSPDKAFLAQAHFSLEAMSQPTFDGSMPGEFSAHYKWSSFDAIRFLADLATEYDFRLKEEIDPRDVRKLNALDLCASGGGQALGIEAAGYYVHGLVDRDPDSLRTLKFNRRGWHVVKADLAAPVSFAEINVWRGTKRRAANLDLVSASFPIAPFSYKKIREGELFSRAVSLIETLNPKAFFFETGLAFGELRNDEFRQDLIASFANLGYKTKKWRLNAQEFGVPQDRTRMYLVGIKNELGDLCAPTRSTKKATVGPAIWTTAFPELSDFGAYEVKKALFGNDALEVVEDSQDRSEAQRDYDEWAKAWAYTYGDQVAPDLDRHRVQPRGSSAHLWRNAGFSPQRSDLPRLGDRVLKRYTRVPL